MAIRRETDLFWWILGGVLLAAGATAAIVSTMPSTARTAAPPEVAVLQAPTPPPVAPAREEPPPAAPVVATADPAPLPEPPQIWQCESNGQKVFSDSRCGTDAAPIQLNDMNRMDATPASARQADVRQAYDYGYAPDYPPDHPPDHPPDYPPNYADPIYTGPLVINPRLARARYYRPHPQGHGAPHHH